MYIYGMQMTHVDCLLARYRLKLTFSVIPTLITEQYNTKPQMRVQQLSIHHPNLTLEQIRSTVLDGSMSFCRTRSYCHVEHSSALGNVFILALPSFFPVLFVPFSPLTRLVFILGPLRLRRGMGRDGLMIVSKKTPMTLTTDHRTSVMKLKRKIDLFSTTVPSDLMYGIVIRSSIWIDRYDEVRNDDLESKF